MLGFFQALHELNPAGRNVAATVIDEKFFGEKALFSDGKALWQSREKGFWHGCQLQLDEVQSSGVYEIGGVRVFCEMLGGEKKMVICGGGHVSIPMIQMGRMLGFQVYVLEDRPKFADCARQAGALEVICEPFAQGLARIKGDKDTFFVIVTRGHRYDQVCLEAIVEKEHAYIGMIGSRRRAAKVKEAILEKGRNPDVVNRVYTPIGLEIGAETPEEIAVAVMAEIIQVKNKGKRYAGYSRELVQAVLNCPDDPKVLATIVNRKGSAPREIGTKMLTLPGGDCIGTIGGGCVEAEIVRKALSMMHSDERKSILYHVDMTGEDAEEEGMACGGIIDVLLEPVWAFTPKISANAGISVQNTESSRRQNERQIW